MNVNYQLTAIAALLSASSFANAALTTSTAAINFSGSASVTATGGQVSSATNSNNGASIANVSLGQFDATNGVLTGVNLQLASNRTQTINGSGNKNNGPGRTVSGSGTSNALLTAAGVSTSFTPNLTQAGSGCALAHGPTGPVSCSWGPNTSAATATSTTAAANSANLDDYVGGGTVNAALSLPTLSATSTMSATQGQPGSGSTATYKVDWAGTLQAEYSYLLHAAASFDGSNAQNSLTLDFGSVLQGASVSPLAFSIFNQANADRVGLDLDSVSAGTGDTAQLTSNLAAFSSLIQGSSTGFNAFLDTSTVGAFSAQYILNLSDANVGASSTRQNYQLTLNITGNVTAVPVPGAVWLFSTALVGLLGLGRRKLAA